MNPPFPFMPSCEPRPVTMVPRTEHSLRSLRRGRAEGYAGVGIRTRAIGLEGQNPNQARSHLQKTWMHPCSGPPFKFYDRYAGGHFSSKNHIVAFYPSQWCGHGEQASHVHPSFPSPGGVSTTFAPRLPHHPLCGPTYSASLRVPLSPPSLSPSRHFPPPPSHATLTRPHIHVPRVPGMELDQRFT